MVVSSELKRLLSNFEYCHVTYLKESATVTMFNAEVPALNLSEGIRNKYVRGIPQSPQANADLLI